MLPRALIVLLIGFGLSVQAQPFGGGLRVGLNASQIAGDGMSGYNKSGFGGAFLSFYYINETNRMQLELGYTRKGSARRPDVDDPSITQFNRRLNYVEIPLLYQSQFGLLRIGAGLAVDVLTSASEKIDGYPNNSFNRKDWNKLCVNSVVELQYNLTQNLVFLVRSTNSLHSIRKNSVPGNVRRFSRQFGEYNDVLFFGLGWEMKSRSTK